MQSHFISFHFISIQIKVVIDIIFSMAAVRATFEPVVKKTYKNQKWLTTVKGQLIVVISTQRRNINSILIPLYSNRDN